MINLEIREKEIFRTLKKLIDRKFVIIGGYAVNVYTLPRFSVDCDLAVKKEEVKEILRILEQEEYKKEKARNNLPYHGEFIRYEKEIKNNFKVSFDILIEKVIDRQTSAYFDVDWILNNSEFKILKGKTFKEEINARIPTAEVLVIMKLLSCRINDIRDIFMIIPNVKDYNYIRKVISEKTNFNNQFKKLIDTISSKNFKDNLQGVFGFIPEYLFDRNKKLISKLNI
ncbi:hypothetical protein HYX16_05270 [Candidatus Woesearchaeota archaeon]|nr:hypothetical protein [Candidatus Woesearchaeota archaeon]